MGSTLDHQQLPTSAELDKQGPEYGCILLHTLQTKLSAYGSEPKTDNTRMCTDSIGFTGSPIVDGPEVYEDRDSAQREAEGPRASMDYSEFTLLDTKKTQIERARIRAIRESNCTSVTRTGQRTPPTVCCWTSPIPSPSPSPSRGYSLVNDPSGLRAS